MSIREIKTFEIECTICRTTQRYEGYDAKYQKPAGWTTRRVGPCGMTGYDRTEDVCPMCAEEAARDQP